MSTGIDALVQSSYGSHVKSNESSDYSSYNTLVASAFGYSPDELSSLPTNANLGLSCGNPLATANLNLGETMIDLGSGGGLDVFLAAKKVGPSGKAIGIDMTDDMLDLARRNAKKGGYTNVEFVKSNITSIPLPSSSANVITSNCVINLVPDAQKPLVFAEIFRLLVPGGRTSISDILAKKEFPAEIREDAGLYIGCVSGASEVGEYERWLREAGFSDIVIVNTDKDLNVYKDGILQTGTNINGSNADKSKPSTGSGCCAPTQTTQSCGGSTRTAIAGCCASTQSTDNGVDVSEERKKRIQNVNLNEFVGSYQIYAVKPGKN